MLLFLVSETMLFFSFFLGYFYYSVSPSIWIGGVWPAKGVVAITPCILAAINTFMLLSSGVTFTWAHAAFKKKNQKFKNGVSRNSFRLKHIIRSVNFGIVFPKDYKACTDLGQKKSQESWDDLVLTVKSLKIDQEILSDKLNTAIAQQAQQAELNPEIIQTSYFWPTLGVVVGVSFGFYFFGINPIKVVEEFWRGKPDLRGDLTELQWKLGNLTQRVNDTVALFKENIGENTENVQVIFVELARLDHGLRVANGVTRALAGNFTGSINHSEEGIQSIFAELAKLELEVQTLSGLLTAAGIM
jgi:hypothetical protein